MIVCKRVIYSGRVQGVGFRYTVSGLSRHHAVAGTVRNCSDGNVELVAQGEVEHVKAFMDAIALRMSGYIAEQKAQDVPAGEMQGFQIIR